MAFLDETGERIDVDPAHYRDKSSYRAARSRAGGGRSVHRAPGALGPGDKLICSRQPDSLRLGSVASISAGYLERSAYLDGGIKHRGPAINTPFKTSVV